MGDFILYKQHERVVTLTLNRPEVRNAIGDLEQCEELISAIQKANSDRLRLSRNLVINLPITEN